MSSEHTPVEHPPAEEPMESVREFGRGWDRFWFAPSDPTTLGLIRLTSGLVIFYCFLCYSWDLMSYVGPQAWMDEPITTHLRSTWPTVNFPDDWSGRPLQWCMLTDDALFAMRANAAVPDTVLKKIQPLSGIQYESREAFLNALAVNLSREEFAEHQMMIAESAQARVPMRVEVAKGQQSWSIFFHLREPHWIWTAHILILVSTLLFALGFATQITSVLTFLGAVSYIWRAFTSLFGLDAMIIVVLFYMMIAPAGATLSIDRWLYVRRERKRLRDPNAVIALQPLASATFATRMLQIHFCIIYLAAGTSKLLGGAWWNGTALWACYANYSFAPMRVPLYNDFLVFLCHHRWLWEIFMSGGALFTLFMELSFAYLVWIPRWRWLMVTGSVLLHTGIGLFMGLVTFSLVMLCMVMAFIPPEASKLFLARVAENFRWLRHLVSGRATGVGKAAPAPAR